MKRSDIRGFTVNMFGFSVEYVSVFHVPSVLAISKGIKTLYRIERS